MASVVGPAVIEGMTEAAVGPLLSKLSREVYRIHAFQGDVEALKRQFIILRKVPQNIWNKWKICRRISRLSKELRDMEELVARHGLSWQQVEPTPPSIEQSDVKTASILCGESFTVGLDAKVSEFRFGAVGLGGTGKTRLLKHVYKEVESIFDPSIWLCVLQI